MPENSKPWAGTWGSLVLYSPASFYSVMGQEGSTVAAAHKAGGTGMDMEPSEITELFPLVN